MPKPWIDDSDQNDEQPWGVGYNDASLDEIERAGCQAFGWAHFWKSSTFDPQFETCGMCKHMQRKPHGL